MLEQEATVKQCIKFLLEHVIEQNRHSAAAHQARNFLRAFGFVEDKPAFESAICLVPVAGTMPPTAEEEAAAKARGETIPYIAPIAAHFVEPAPSPGVEE